MPPDPGLVSRVKAARQFMAAKAIAHLLKRHPNTITNWIALPGDPDRHLKAAIERLVRDGA
jgi:hypothetical protein